LSSNGDGDGDTKSAGEYSEEISSDSSDDSSASSGETASSSRTDCELPASVEV